MNIKAERISSIACLIISIIFLVLIQYQASPAEMPGSRGFALLTGQFFPYLAVFLFIFSSVSLLLGTFSLFKVNKKNDEETKKAWDMVKESDEGTTAEASGISLVEFAKALGITILGLVYVYSLPVLGYWAATSIVAFALTYFLGSRNWLTIILIAFVFPFLCRWAFIEILYVPLPKGFFGI